MKRTVLIFLSLLCVLLPLRAPVHGAPSGALAELVHRGTLTIAINAPYPPMEYIDSRTLPQGVDVELGRALAMLLNLNAVFVQVDDFDTIIPGLLHHRYDIIMSSMTITPARQKLVSFIPYMVAGASIVVATGNLKHVQTLADLAGLNASTQAATTEEDMVTAENKDLAKKGLPLIALKTYTDDTTALTQLVRGQSDAYLTDYPVAVYRVLQSHGTLAIAGKQFEVVPYGIAVGKDTPGLYSLLTTALRTLREEGSYRRILNHFNVSQGALP